ncbi:MAG: hypothetical protein JXR49_12780 [Acidobacteria bacterium]|nr:hypothetical protein [Acidobacteriota bacterium]
MKRKAGLGIGIGIGIDRKVENLFFQTYMQIPDADSEPDSDPDPQCAPIINVRGTAKRILPLPQTDVRITKPAN